MCFLHRFVQSFYNALTENGVFIAQIGRSPYGVDGGNDETSVFKNAFQDVGFQSIHIYDEVRLFNEYCIFLFILVDIHNILALQLCCFFGKQ